MILNYIKIAWKVLLRHPFYTFITLFGISLTLTVLMVLTSFLDHLMGSHYPEFKRDRSLYVMQVAQFDSIRQSSRQGPSTFKFLTEYVKTLKTPEKVSFSTIMGSSNTYVNGRRLKLSIKYCDATFWEIYDFKFLEGQPFNEQHITNGEKTIVITEAIKKQYFENGEESVVGKNMEIDNEKYKVIGVVKTGPITRILSYADVYFPYTMPKSNYQKTGFNGSYYATILARNKADLPLIQQEFDAAIDRISLPRTEEGFTYYFLDVSARNYIDNFFDGLFFGAEAGKKIYVIIALIMLMLMGLPAINLVNLNVSRIMERASEIGIRKAFGAPARTLASQFIIENIFITLIGGLLALVLTFGIIQLINNSGMIPYADLTINFSVFSVSILVCFVFGLLSGVVPALRMSKLKVVEALKNT